MQEYVHKIFYSVYATYYTSTNEPMKQKKPLSAGLYSSKLHVTLSDIS